MPIKALILLLLITLPSCKKSPEAVLVIADAVKIDRESADPAKVATSAIGNLILSDFSYRDNDLVWHNLLAEEVIPLPDGKGIEIRIRKGVRFHDGMEMTASVAAASFNETIERDKHLKERIRGLKAEVVDGSRIRVTSEGVLTDLNPLLSDVHPYKSNLVGTGPYKLNRWLENGVELAANRDYFEGPPKLKWVIYRYEPDERKRVNMLLKGEADLLVWLSPEMAGFLKKDQRFYVNEWPADFYTALFLNNSSPLFSDSAVRRAVSLAIDRDKLIKKVLNGGGKKVSGPLPHPANSTGIPGYSPKEAAGLLSDAGWRDTDGDGILEKNGKRLRIRLYYNNEVEEFRKMADIIAQDLFEIGIGVEPVPASQGEIGSNSFKSGEYDALLEAKPSSDSNNLATWSSSSSNNISRLNSREMDNLLDRLGETTDIEQKNGIYSKMQRVFEEEVPAVFLYNPVIYTAVNRKFKGSEEFVGSVYSVYKIKDWSIDERYK